MKPFLLITLASITLAADNQPAADQVALTRSGDDACVDLPRPPEGVPGLREYARVRIEHDGQLVVTAAQLPFTSNQGYLYRQTEKGWVANEMDYLLLRTPVPVRGGFIYIINVWRRRGSLRPVEHRCAASEVRSSEFLYRIAYHVSHICQ